MRAPAGYELKLGPDHICTLQTSMNVGTLLCLQRKLSKAERVYQVVVSGFRRALGPNHIHTFGTVNNWPISAVSRVNCLKLKSFTNKLWLGSLELWDNITTLSGGINKQGLLYAEQGNSDVARRMYQEARAGFQRSLGLEHPHTKMAYNYQQIW
jgi:hypothetical protein